MCIYWVQWYKTSLLSEEIFSKLHKSCLVVLKAEPWAVCTRWWILPGLGGALASACLLHWRASLPVLLGEPRNGLGSGWNQSALLLLQGKSLAQCPEWPVSAASTISSICSRVLTYWASHSAELLMICLLQNSFLKTRKASNWACSGVTVLHNKPFHHFPKCLLCKTMTSGYKECISISGLSNWDLSFWFWFFYFFLGQLLFFKTFGVKCFSFLKDFSFKCQFYRIELFFPFNLSPFTCFHWNFNMYQKTLLQLHI